MEAVTTKWVVVPEEQHNRLVEAVFRSRGFNAEEASHAVRICAEAARHGIHSHNALKALHLDLVYGSGAGGSIPGAEITELPMKFPASRVWNANKKMGPAVAWQAMDLCMNLAAEFGVGIVSVDNAFHYLWGGGYVLHGADKGFITYTSCTGLLPEVVPYGGKVPTLGTNPHSWGFPTKKEIGFNIVIDWATSVIAMGRVQAARREGILLPELAAVDKEGVPTTNPQEAVALLPFGAHKGYGLGLVNELLAAFIGGSLPTLRGIHQAGSNEKTTSSFFFSAIHPDAISSGAFAKNRSQSENVRAVIQDILRPGNEHCLLPGEPEAKAAAISKKAGGFIFSEAEVAEFNQHAARADAEPLRPIPFKTA